MNILKGKGARGEYRTSQNLETTAIENKNYSGWIFGDEQSKNWCETLKGKKYFFYNPVKQNRSHIKNLERLLQIGEEKYISLITFNTNANLKKNFNRK